MIGVMGIVGEIVGMSVEGDVGECVFEVRIRRRGDVIDIGCLLGEEV